MRRFFIFPFIILCLSAAIRVPCMYDIPPFGGANENVISFEILEGRHSLINQYPHIGSLSPYIVAAFLTVFGRHWWVVRLVPLTFAIGTILLTWRLGRQQFGNLIGALSAVFLSVAFYHVVFTSHFPWSNNLTPFFSTAFLLALHRSATEPTALKSIGWGALSGLMYGFGLQSHPEMIVLFPMIPLTFMFAARHLLRWILRPAFYSLGLFALMGYANMIYYNLSTRMQTVSFGLTYPQYALVEEYTVRSILSNHFKAVIHLARMVLGFADDSLSWTYHATHPAILLFWITLITGLYLSIRSRRFLIPFAFLSSLALIPLANRSYTFALGRYLVFLFPLASILAAVAILETLRITRTGSSRLFAGVIRTIACAVMLFLILFPLVRIRDYYTEQFRLGDTSRPFWNLKSIVDSVENQSTFILVDDTLPWGFNFVQFLREDGRAARLMFWDAPLKPPFDDLMIQKVIAAEFAKDSNRSILAVVHEDNISMFLSRIPVRRIVGNLDFTTIHGWQNMCRVLEIGRPKGQEWLNQTVLPARMASSDRMYFKRRFDYCAAPIPDFSPRFEPRIAHDRTTGDIAVVWDHGDLIGCAHVHHSTVSATYIHSGDLDGPPAVSFDSTGNPQILFVNTSSRRLVIRSQTGMCPGMSNDLAVIGELPDETTRVIATTLEVFSSRGAVLTEQTLNLVDAFESRSPEITTIPLPSPFAPAVETDALWIAPDGTITIARLDESGSICLQYRDGWETTVFLQENSDRLIGDASGLPIGVSFKEDITTMTGLGWQFPKEIWQAAPRISTAEPLVGLSNRMGVHIRRDGLALVAQQDATGRIRCIESSIPVRADAARMVIEPVSEGMHEFNLGGYNPGGSSVWDLYIGIALRDGTVRYYPDWTTVPQAIRTPIAHGDWTLGQSIRFDRSSIPFESFMAFAFAAVPDTVYPITAGSRIIR